MGSALVVGVGLAGAIGGLVAGLVLGVWAGRRSAMPQELIALALSGEHARIAFANAEPRAAWEVLTRHSVLVRSNGRCLGLTGQHLELMVTHARFAVLSKELGQSDALPLAAALEECRAASSRDCSPERVVSLAGRRTATTPTSEGSAR